MLGRCFHTPGYLTKQHAMPTQVAVQQKEKRHAHFLLSAPSPEISLDQTPCASPSVHPSGKKGNACPRVVAHMYTEALAKPNT